MLLHGSQPQMAGVSWILPIISVSEFQLPLPWVPQNSVRVKPRIPPLTTPQIIVNRSPLTSCNDKAIPPPVPSSHLAALQLPTPDATAQFPFHIYTSITATPRTMSSYPSNPSRHSVPCIPPFTATITLLKVPLSIYIPL